MSSTPPTHPHPDRWVEDKIIHGAQRMRECRGDLRSAIARRPLCSVAVGFGVGYVARSVPVLGLTAASLRFVVGFLPHTLLAIGAARAWEFLRSDKLSAQREPADEDIVARDELLQGEPSAIHG